MLILGLRSFSDDYICGYLTSNLFTYLLNYYCNYKSSERRRRTAGESSCIPSPSPQSQTWQVMSAEHLSVCCSRGQICGHGTEMLPHVDDYYYCITCTHLVFKCLFCNNWNGIEEVRFLFFISVFLVQPTQCFLPSNSNLYMATVKPSNTQSLHVSPIANCCCLHGAKLQFVRSRVLKRFLAENIYLLLLEMRLVRANQKTQNLNTQLKDAERRKQSCTVTR